MKDSKSVVRRLIEEMDKGNLDIFDELCTEDYVYHFPGNPEPLDRDAHRESARGFYTAFPNMRHTVADQIAEGDRVVTRLTNSGTHKGEFLGIAPTGTEVAFTVIGIARLDGGKIAEEWIEGDLLGLLRQLGVELPAGDEGPALAGGD